VVGSPKAGGHHALAFWFMPVATPGLFGRPGFVRSNFFALL